jgi:hypothetical protein
MEDLSFLFRGNSYPYWDKQQPTIPNSSKPGLKHFLDRLLRSSIPDRILGAMLSDEFRPRWEKSFTHTSASPNNYERVEFVGDKFEGAAFAEYIQERFPSVRAEGPLTDFVAYYLGKSFLTTLTTKFEFDGVSMMSLIWVDSNFQPALRWVLLEDVWEALVGTIFEVGQIVGPPLVNGSIGYQLVSNFVRTTFNNVNINPDLTKNAFSKNFRLRARALNLTTRDIASKDLLTAGRKPGSEQRVMYILAERKSLPQEILLKVSKPDREKALVDIASRMTKEGKKFVASEWAIIGVGTDLTVSAALENASKEALDALFDMKPAPLKDISEYNRLMIRLQDRIGDFRWRQVDIPGQMGRYSFLETTYQDQPVYLATYYSDTSAPVEQVRVELLKEALRRLDTRS